MESSKTVTDRWGFQIPEGLSRRLKLGFEARKTFGESPTESRNYLIFCPLQQYRKELQQYRKQLKAVIRSFETYNVGDNAADPVGLAQKNRYRPFI